MSIFAVLDPVRNKRSLERKRRFRRRRNILIGSIAVVWLIIVLAACVSGMIGLCYWLGML